MKIAIIGSGISGLGAAYILSGRHDVTVFEQDNRLGGHSRTIEVPSKSGAGMIPVDTGFIVFNDRNYPNLCGLFNHLNVPIKKSDMSFGVSAENGAVEYGSKGIFAQKRNLCRPQFWRMLADILTFNRRAERYLQNPELTLAECLAELRMGDWFRRYYLLAMGASIWSCSPQMIEQFPAASFIRFFKNHGLLTVNNHPQWYTVDGGSRVYVNRLRDAIGEQRVRTMAAVHGIMRGDNGVTLFDNRGECMDFDAVVLACHADQALAVLKDADEVEKRILGAFQFQKNSIVVHGDESFMPEHKSAWASWVYLSQSENNGLTSVSLTYWMNNLQSLDSSTPILVTLNPGRMPNPSKIYDQYDFDHPIFNLAAIKAQNEIERIQSVRRTYFCGAWQRYGFHEDGLWSAVRVAKLLGVDPPWA